MPRSKSVRLQFYWPYGTVLRRPVTKVGLAAFRAEDRVMSLGVSATHSETGWFKAIWIDAKERKEVLTNCNPDWWEPVDE